MAEELITDLIPDDDTADDDLEGDPDGISASGEVPHVVLHDDDAGDTDQGDDRSTVYGDSAYGTGPIQSRLEDVGIDSTCKTQGPNATNALFAEDRLAVNLTDDTVTCPAGLTVAIRRHAKGGGVVKFADACDSCILRPLCTKAAEVRSISVAPNEAVLARARARQNDPWWVGDYRTTRPKVERKLAHLIRRKHGGRRARVRGTARVGADFSLLAAAVDLARLGNLGACSTPTGWTVVGS